MTHAELDRVLRIVSRQRPFRPYAIEFVSGGRILVTHPELIDRRGDVYLFIARDGDYRLFAPASVSHILPPDRPPGT